VFAAAHFENRYFDTAPVGEHFRRDRRAGYEGLADSHRVAIADEQDLIETTLAAKVCRYLVYFEFFAGGNAILLAAGFYDRVHIDLLIKMAPRRSVCPSFDGFRWAVSNGLIESARVSHPVLMHSSNRLPSG
jgi:hypothetical protein